MNRTFSFDITNHVNSIIEGDLDATKVLIQSSNKARGAERSIIYGSEHSEFPAKFKLVSSIP